jgi:hypothetical protein
MALDVRPGDLDGDEQSVLDLFVRYLNPDYDKARFDWLYRANPAGRGRFWVATDGPGGRLIATAAAFPRTLYFRGRLAVGWVLADFCVAEGYRALGPAVMLQRACLKDLSASPGSCWYDFPAAAMMPVYRRLAQEPVARMTRLVKHLRVDGKLAAIVPGRSLACALGSIANRLLRRRLRPSRAAQNLETAVHEGPCGPEFTALSERVAPTYALCLSRSARYLTWRFRENPLQVCEIVTTRRRGQLLAYTVIVQEGTGATLLDVFGVQDHRVITVLLKATLALLYDRGCETVSCGLLDSHPWVPYLKRLGFVTRESTSLMLHTTDEEGPGSPGIAEDVWFLTSGDRDA